MTEISQTDELQAVRERNAELRALIVKLSAEVREFHALVPRLKEDARRAKDELTCIKSGDGYGDWVFRGRDTDNPKFVHLEPLELTFIHRDHEVSVSLDGYAVPITADKAADLGILLLSAVERDY